MAIDERELTDAALVEAVQRGDAEAFTELFRRHYPSVRRICARRLGSTADGDEVAQAAFVRAYERIDQCVGERRFGAWVQVIAYRLGADSRRLQARSVVTDQLVTDRLAGADALLGPNHCEDAVIRGEEAAALHQVLATLPPRQRDVIVARDLEGRRPGEIADSLGLSLGAVDSLLLRARRRVAAAWQSGRPEGGAVAPHVAGASLAATSAAATVSDAGSLRLLSRLGDAIARASVRLAGGLGIISDTRTLAQRVTGVVAAGALVAAPVATVVPTSALTRLAGPGGTRAAAASRPSHGPVLRAPAVAVPLAVAPPAVALPVDVHKVVPEAVTAAIPVTPPVAPAPTVPAVALPAAASATGASPAGISATVTGAAQVAAAATGAAGTAVTGAVGTVSGVVSGVRSAVGGAAPATGAPQPAVPPVVAPVIGAVTSSTVGAVGSQR